MSLEDNPDFQKEAQPSKRLDFSSLRFQAEQPAKLLPVLLTMETVR